MIRAAVICAGHVLCCELTTLQRKSHGRAGGGCHLRFASAFGPESRCTRTGPKSSHRSGCNNADSAKTRERCNAPGRFIQIGLYDCTQRHITSRSYSTYRMPQVNHVYHCSRMLARWRRRPEAINCGNVHVDYALAKIDGMSSLPRPLATWLRMPPHTTSAVGVPAATLLRHGRRKVLVAQDPTPLKPCEQLPSCASFKQVQLCLLAGSPV